jgi:signal transduction histidine kinase
MEQRRDLFLIFKEAIHNIVQHSGADATNIVVTLNEKSFILQISDNGKGFDKNALPYLNGLDYMQKRANKYRWNLEITSGAMKGTCVTLKIKPV